MPLSDLIAEAREQLAVNYTAVFLDRDDTKRLLAWWESEVGTALLPDVRADHVTLQFDPSEQDLADLPVGQTVSARVLGFAENDRVQAVRVQSVLLSAKQHPHVTIAVAPGARSSEADDLLSQGYVRRPGPTLRGVVRVRKARP